MSAAFAPAMVGGTVGSVDESKAACVQAGARESTRLLRYAMRTYQQALDRIAGTEQTADQKTRLVAWARARVERAQARSVAAVGETCPAGAFADAYRRSTDEFLGSIAAQAGCMVGFVYVQDAVTCPAPVCGNGMQERGEECDDGNDFDGDGCRADCVATECDAFGTTFELIQRAIFENHGCTNDACHGNAQSGGLDLRAGVVVRAVDRRAVEHRSGPQAHRARRPAAQPAVSQARVEDAARPVRLRGARHRHADAARQRPGLTQDELEAVRLWIFAAAAKDGSVPGVGDLLNACLPEPEPLEIKPLDPPPANEGIQLQMPPWIVRAHSEHEVCFGSYYDLTDQVPAEMRGDGDTFCYNAEQLRQDPLSHHLIVNLYTGAYGPEDPSWGGFHCDGGALDGQTCDPTVKDACGAGAFCITAMKDSIACNGFGPDDGGRAAVPFSGAQKTNASSAFPDGAYRCVPLKGMIWWNSHAFNLTDKDGLLRAWINFRYAKPDERLYFSSGIFDLSAIFKMVVPAFQQQEVCNINVLPKNANLFELTSHMHQRGKRWRTFRGEFTCQGQVDGQGKPIPCDPLSPAQCNDGVACAAPDARDPMASLIYTNFVYNDPVELRFDPPMVFTGNKRGALDDLLRPLRQRLHRSDQGEAAVDVTAEAGRLVHLRGADELLQRQGRCSVQRRHGRGAAPLVRLERRRRRRTVRCVHPARRRHHGGRDVPPAGLVFREAVTTDGHGPGRTRSVTSVVVRSPGREARLACAVSATARPTWRTSATASSTSSTLRGWRAPA